MSWALKDKQEAALPRETQCAGPDGKGPADAEMGRAQWRYGTGDAKGHQEAEGSALGGPCGCESLAF